MKLFKDSHKEPSSVEFALGLNALAWLILAIDAYMEIDIQGAVHAVFAGLLYLVFIPVCSKWKEWPLLFGWDDDFITGWLRQSFIALIFFGPLVKHTGVWLAGDLLHGDRAYIATLPTAVVIGFMISMRISIKKST